MAPGGAAARRAGSRALAHSAAVASAALGRRPARARAVPLARPLPGDPAVILSRLLPRRRAHGREHRGSSSTCHLLVLYSTVQVLYSFENSAPKVSAILLSQYCSCAPSGIASEPVASRAHTRRALRFLCSTAPATETQNFFLSL